MTLKTGGSWPSSPSRRGQPSISGSELGGDLPPRPALLAWIVLFSAFFAACGLFALFVAQRRRPGGGALVVGVWLATMVMLFSYSSIDKLRVNYLESSPWLTTPIAWGIGVVIVAFLMYHFRERTALHTRGGHLQSARRAVRNRPARLQDRNVRDTDVRSVQRRSAGRGPAQRIPGMNVYYILIDAYAGRAGLKQVTGLRQHAVLHGSRKARIRRRLLGTLELPADHPHARRDFRARLPEDRRPGHLGFEAPFVSGDLRRRRAARDDPPTARRRL